jgi:hypothetical protein
LRYVPQWRPEAWYLREAEQQLANFRARRVAKLVLTTGSDISAGAYLVIESKVSERLAPALRTLDSIVRYLDRHPLSLAVLISNIGEMVAILDCVCRARGIPTFLIINGLLGKHYLDESKYATLINAYGPSIQQDYFEGMTNTVALGDPRMDQYPPARRRLSRPDRPFSIAIGASGHSNVDLNSYVAVEFDFLFDVLSALETLRSLGQRLRVTIKVRANGYRRQYEQFIDEYFPGLVDEVLDQGPIRSLLAASDFYVSIYSQTLFEASCLGVPCVYYRKDNEVHAPPFDGRSELAVVDSVEGLVIAVSDALNGHSRFEGFLERSTMERYVGPLDGGCLERNLTQIYDMVGGVPHDVDVSTSH